MTGQELAAIAEAGALNLLETFFEQLIADPSQPTHDETEALIHAVVVAISTLEGYLVASLPAEESGVIRDRLRRTAEAYVRCRKGLFTGGPRIIKPDS